MPYPGIPKPQRGMGLRRCSTGLWKGPGGWVIPKKNKRPPQPPPAQSECATAGRHRRGQFHLVRTGSAGSRPHRHRYITYKASTAKIFNPECAEKAYGGDRFVVPLGGKFELRKGQDLVSRAFKALQDAHTGDAAAGPGSTFGAPALTSTSASPYIRFQPSHPDKPRA